MEEGRRSLEVSGRTVAEATDKALEELGADSDQVAIEVLSQGSRGILGLGGEQARVRVTLIDTTEYPEEEAAVESLEEEAAEESPESRAEISKVAAEVLGDLLRHMGIQATVVVREPSADKPARVMLDVQGDDLGILIGRQGDTLRDLQYITKLIASRKLQRWVNIVVDVAGYKIRRERVLTELAQRMAERVVADGRPLTLEPMPAHERRIVHMALRNHRQVTTESMGEEPRRKVVISPVREVPPASRD
jgi:spoIIIJ-associated protein